METKVKTLEDAVFGMKCKHGWHLGNTIPLGDGQKRDIQKVPPAMVVFITHEHIDRPQLEWIKSVRDDCIFVFRPYFVPSDSLAAYQAYEDKCVDMLTWHNGWEFLEEGRCFLQPYNEPNMPWKMPDGSINTQWEGFGTQSQAIARYNERFCVVHDRAKATNPKFKTVVMNLTPGNHDVFFPSSGQVWAAVISGKRNRIGPDGDQKYWATEIQPLDAIGEHYYMHGPQSAKPNPTPQEIQDSIESCLCRDALLRADVLGSHIYVVNGGTAIDALWLGRRFVQQTRFLPKDMPILITECGIGGDFSGIRRWYDHIHDCNGQDAEHPNVLATSWWRLGFEVRDGPLVEDLHNYYLEFDGDPPPEPPPPPDLCEEALNTTDDELVCIVAADLAAVLQHYYDNGWPVGKPHQQRAVICDWLQSPGFLNDEKYGGTWEGYMVYWGCREAEQPLPTPDFSAEPTSGGAPLQVQFTNLTGSEEDVGSFRWFFFDSEQNFVDWDPVRTYNNLGPFDVLLRVWRGPNETGEFADMRKKDYIAVYGPPIAAFTADPVLGEAPLTVAFTDMSLGEIDEWVWDFGDGSVSEQHPSHYYAGSGNYTVSLTVTGPGGTDSLQRIGYIQVLEPPEPPPPPTVDFYAEPTKGVAPLTVRFYNASEGMFDALEWDFGDGIIVLLPGIDAPTHVYAEGVYAVTLTLFQNSKPFSLTKPGYIEVLSKPEPEPPKIRKFHFAISGTVTLTEAGPDELPIDADISRVSVVEQNGQLYVA